MKVMVQAAIFLLLSGNLFANDEGYRIAGVIAYGFVDWRAIIESPDGEQKLVREGDFIDQAEVVSIFEDGVIFQFPGGVSQMRLSQGDFIPQERASNDINAKNGSPYAVSKVAGTNNQGINADDFSRLLNNKLSASQLRTIRGLDVLNTLSDSARIVSFSNIGPSDNSIAIDSLESGVSALQQAITSGMELRVSVQGDEAITNFYIMPAEQNQQ